MTNSFPPTTLTSVFQTFRPSKELSILNICEKAGIRMGFRVDLENKINKGLTDETILTGELVLVGLWW